ncbi:MAG: hypothetical protein ABFC94_18875 [Syntrophomonas sp.]
MILETKDSEMPKIARQLNSRIIPESTISYYYFTLINKNSQLDLRNYRVEIDNAVQKILSGGASGRSYSNILRINVLMLSKTMFKLEVEQDNLNKDWARNLSKYFIKENPDQLRHFVSPSDPTRLFDVSR